MSTSASPRWRAVLDSASSVALIVAAAVVVWSTLRSPRPANPNSRELAVPPSPVSIVDSAVDGSLSAPLAMIIYSDFECPFCGAFARETVPRLRREYVSAGLLKIVFKHLPLDIHKNARQAAEIAECGRRSGTFWNLHDQFFAHRAPENDFWAGLEQFAESMPGVPDCLRTGDPARVIDRDVAEAKALGISSTPSFLIGVPTGTNAVQVKSTLVGARPVGDFINRLDALRKNVTG